MPAFEKGSSVKSSFEAVRGVVGEELWPDVLAELSDEERGMVLAAERHLLIPCSVTGRFYSAVHRVAGGGDRARTEQLLRTSGRADADTMLDGIFSVFARFVSPLQALRRGAPLVASVYEGVGLETSEDADGLGGKIVLTGLGEEPFCACVISGWLERAVERFGAKNPTVRERSFDAGQDASDRLEFALRWE